MAQVLLLLEHPGVDVAALVAGLRDRFPGQVVWVRHGPDGMMYRYGRPGDAVRTVPLDELRLGELPWFDAVALAMVDPVPEGITFMRLVALLARQWPRIFLVWTGGDFQEYRGLSAWWQSATFMIRESWRKATIPPEDLMFDTWSWVTLRLPRPSPTKRGGGIVLYFESLGLGGAQRQALLLLEGLVARGMKVRLVTLADSRQEFYASAFAGLPVDYVLPRRLIEQPWRLSKVFADHARSFGPDLAMTFLSNTYAFSTPALARVGVPRIINGERFLASHYYAHRPDADRWRLRISRAARAADLTVANSEAGRADLVSYTGLPPTRFRAIPNGFDPTTVIPPTEQERAAARAAFGFPEPVQVVGIAGRLAPEKNHRLFLDAFARVAAHHPKARAVIVGDGPLRGSLQAHAEELGIGHLLRFQPANAKPWATISAFDVFALSSDSEGQPNVLIEALHLGVPCVSTAAGGAPEVVKDGQWGYVVPCGNADKLAEAMARALGDPFARRLFVERGRHFVHTELSVERMVSAYADLFQELMSERGKVPTPLGEPR